MNMTYKAYYYLKGSGRAPVEEFAKGLKDDRKITVVIEWIETLIRSQVNLPPTFIKHVWKKVHELRIQSKYGQFRIFYFMAEQGKIILLDGYAKKTDKIPLRILEKVKFYYKDYLIHHYEKAYE